MTSPDTGEITKLLHKIEQGDQDAYNRLVRLVRASLKRIAANRLRRDRRLDTKKFLQQSAKKIHKYYEQIAPGMLKTNQQQ